MACTLRIQTSTPDAVKLKSISHLDAIRDENISVMDNAAVSLAMDNGLPIRVFDLLTRGNIQRIVNGESIGTLVSKK